MSNKKIYLAITFVSVVFVFAYIKPLLTALTFFVLIAITAILFSIYSVIKGIMLFTTCHKLKRYYDFRLKALNNIITIPANTGFVTAVLQELQQQLQDSQQQESQLRFSDEQQIISSFAPTQQREIS